MSPSRLQCRLLSFGLFVGLFVVAEQDAFGQRFIRGDANADATVDVADASFMLGAIFRHENEFVCDKAADTNDDGLLDVSDAVFEVVYLFRQGPPPPPPFPDCGLDETPDDLDCRSFAPCSQRPLPSFTATPTSGVAPLEVNFDATASVDPDGQIVSYTWEFGDGTSGEGVSTTHTYSEPGRYFAELRVRDDSGLESIDTVVITVEAPVVTTFARSSPVHGEQGVAITRETILEFSGPLSVDSVTLGGISARFAGAALGGRLHVSPDNRTVTLFYLQPLPASARVRVTINGDVLRDADGVLVDADADGKPGGTRTIDFETLTLTTIPGSAVCGRVFASELGMTPEGEPVNTPLEGVTVTVDGMEGELFAITDQFGNFRLDPAPAGRFFVHIDGRTATNGVREGTYYPFVGKSWETVPGEETNIGNVYLPLVAAGTLVEVSAAEETEISFPTTVVEEFPALEGVSIRVPPDVLFSDDGARGGMVGIAPVPPDRLPGELPEGLDFPVVITVQTDGATNFDEPVPVCFPNLPDPETGETLPLGAKSALWSFNHDTGEWQVVGPMTVVEDPDRPGATLVCSDPGVGILAPGWHGSRSGVQGSGGEYGTGGGADGDQEPPNGQPGDASDPIYLFSGEFHVSVQDLYIPGRGLDFKWIRKYRSRIGPNTVQGNGWDYSYNVHLLPSGADIVLCNGNTRADTYKRQPDGSYSSDGFFRDLVRHADGTFTLMFEDTTRWLFHPFDGSARAGGISRIVDRNGNQMRFEYDQGGRLVRVIDSLDRPITIAYNPSGYISTITDFSGRVVRYEYYDGREPGGNAGDLKSVTTPAVVGTPNGNDFPAGKTTSYTYTTGFQDDRLNHNLLTITDGRRNDPNDSTFGTGPYLANVYARTTDEDDTMFDRVVRQILGGDLIDVVYLPMLPSNVNGNAVMRTILNDRNGNVKEYVYNRRNQMVRMREYTGQADPTRPTTDVDNRPSRISRKRPEDPEFFETVYEWTKDSLLRRQIHPNGNITEYVYESDLYPAASPRTRGNLRELRQLPGSHEPTGDQPVLEQFYEYDPRFGGSAYITRHTDPRGAVTVHTYDARGNRIRLVHREPTIVEEWEYNQFGQTIAYTAPDNGSGSRRRDEYTYYDSGPQRGYLRDEIRDASSFRLTTTYEYDLVGNVRRLIDPRGNDVIFERNALNQTLRRSSRRPEADSGLRYHTLYRYDANNNVTQVDIENLDETGQPLPNAFISLTYTYDILNYPVRVTEEVDENRTVVEEYGYDRNKNRVLTRYGEAVSGEQPGNVRQTVFDERDLEFQVIRAPGTGEQSTTQFDYDPNGNLVTVRQGIEDTPRVLRTTFDGYNRVVRVTDPMGNLSVFTYDANNNRTRLQQHGELSDETPEDSRNVLLSDVRYFYDAVDRLSRTETRWFDPETQTDLGGDGVAEGALFYNGSYQTTRFVDARGNDRRMVYDTANRLAQVIDAAGNVETYTYDENDNVVVVTQFEKSDLGDPDEVFRTTFEYDGLDRLTRLTDNIGNTRTFAYDSRDNRTLELDAIRDGRDAPGNIIRNEFDGLCRVVRCTKILSENGHGGGAEVGRIVLEQAWDASNRLISQTDPNGNRTQYDYDALNRLTAVNYADGTRVSVTYDVHDNGVMRVDAIGTVLKTTFDLLNRATHVDISPGEGVSNDTTFEEFKYDGVSRLVMARDDDSEVTRSHDSMSRVIRETLNGQTTRSVYDAVGNLEQCIYPGGRTVIATYDALDRKKRIADQDGPIASYSYIGPERVARKEFDRNGTAVDLLYDGLFVQANAPGDFGVREVVQTIHRKGQEAAFDERHYTWDQMGNKTSLSTVAPARGSRRFAYDSTYRLARSSIRPPNGGEVDIQYDLDAAGNRRAVSGGPGAGQYVLDATSPVPADAQLNQYTVTPFSSRTYDNNGNLRSIHEGIVAKQIEYDHRNRMVDFDDPSGGIHARYSYDALGRRIAKDVEGPSPEHTQYFYEGFRVCEEQNEAGAITATYVYGLYVDEVVSMQRGGSEFFFHSDDLYSVTSVTDMNGAVVERYDYDDFGVVVVYDRSGIAREGSAIGNPYFFTGFRHDPETGLYYCRTRYLHAESGRFTTRDTIGLWGDFNNLGNGYTYVGSNPLTLLDPYGQGFLGDLWAVAKEFPGAFVETAPGSVSILANTYSFGATDKLGITDSEQYRGSEYDVARVTAVISREAALSALTMGANAARGGACMLEGMGRLTPLIKAIQASKHGPKVASLVHKIVEALNAGRDIYDLMRELHKILDGNGSLLNAALSLIGALSGIDNLRSAPGFCFVEDTLVATPEGMMPIVEIQVGDRVAGESARAGPSESVTAPPGELQPADACLVELRFDDPRFPGKEAEVTLLRPRAWLEDAGVALGSVAWLSLPEMGLAGMAHVERIVACTPIRAGPGCLVTGTFKSWSTEVLTLELDGVESAIEATSRHRFYSLSRQNWVPAGELEVGEALLAEHGPATLLRVEQKHGLHQVYNLEVQEGHRFYVSDAKVLVHNSYSTPKRTGSHSRKLADDLAANGYPRPPGGYQAAHIVPTNNFSSRSPAVQKAIKTAQDKLDKYLGPAVRDTEINGFWAQAGHAGTHTDNFFRELGKAFRGVSSKAGADKALKDMWKRIEGGEFIP